MNEEDHSEMGERDNADFPIFEPGDSVRIEGQEYTVESLDPMGEAPLSGDVRTYYLESGDKESIQIQPRYVQQEWQFIRVCSFDINDIENTGNDRGDH